MRRPLFAAVGHQENWAAIEAMVNGVRERERPGAKKLSREDVVSIVDFVPPRVTSRFRVGGPDGIEAIYIETFIRPDELEGRPSREAMRKVLKAIDVAAREGASIATLGGFTSILVEADVARSDVGPTLTSGNALTAGLIVRGVECALAEVGRALEGEDVLVIGASGDVGSGVARHIAGRSKSLTLAARNMARLERERSRFPRDLQIELTTDVLSALPRATLVVAAASTTDNPFDITVCRPGTILADAGYPKNLSRNAPSGVRVFHAGMGTIRGGLHSRDGILEQFYRFPVPEVAHGCMLEGALLAMSDRADLATSGRGNITVERIDELLELAASSGIDVAPQFDGDGLLSEKVANGR